MDHNISKNDDSCQYCDVLGCPKRDQSHISWTEHEVEWDLINKTIVRPEYDRDCDCQVCVTERQRSDTLVNCSKFKYNPISKSVTMNQYNVEFEMSYDSNLSNRIKMSKIVDADSYVMAEGKIINKYPNVKIFSISTLENTGV